MATIGPNGFLINQAHANKLGSGTGALADNLKAQSGVTGAQAKTHVKKGKVVREEEGNTTLSPAAQEALKSQQQQHADHVAEHGHELAHQTGMTGIEEREGGSHGLERKRGWERELPEGEMKDGSGRVVVVSKEGEAQVLSADQYKKLRNMDDAENHWEKVTGDIPDANFNAATKVVEDKMANGASKIANLTTDPKVDAVAEEMLVHDPVPHLGKPLDIRDAANDPKNKPLSPDFPAETERVAAQRAAEQLASGQLHEEAMIAGPGAGSVAATAAAPLALPSPQLAEAEAKSARTENVLAQLEKGPLQHNGNTISQRDGYELVRNDSWDRFNKAVGDLPEPAQQAIQNNLTLIQSDFAKDPAKVERFQKAGPEAQAEFQYTWMAQAAKNFGERPTESLKAAGADTGVSIDKATMKNLTDGANHYLKASQGSLDVTVKEAQAAQAQQPSPGLAEAQAKSAKAENVLAQLEKGPLQHNGNTISQRDGYELVRNDSWDRFNKAVGDLPEPAQQAIQNNLTLIKSDFAKDPAKVERFQKAGPDAQAEFQYTWMAQAAKEFGDRPQESLKAAGADPNTPLDAASMLHLKDGATHYLKASQGSLDVAVKEAQAAQSKAGPGPITPEKAATNAATADLLSQAPYQTWAGVADIMGVKAGQGMGVTPSGTPEQQQQQKQEWRLGHALDLQQQGHGALATQVLQGQWDSLAGQSVLKTSVTNDHTRANFQSHYSNNGGKLVNADFRPKLEDLNGKEVAFLVSDPKTKELSEVRGRLKTGEEGSSMFSLEGQAGEFNRNSIAQLAVLPEKGNVPPMPKTEVPAEALAPKPQPESRTYSRDEMVARAAMSAPTQASQLLLERAGVKAQQFTGADYKPENLQQWRLGQAASMAQAGNGKEMSQVLAGKWDKAAGQDLQSTLQERADFRKDFQAHYRKEGGTYVDHKPQSMHGKQVAFIHENPETGRLEEVRGVVQASADPHSAIFKIQGNSQEFNSNHIENVVQIPNPKIPPFQKTGQTEQTAAPSGMPESKLGAKATTEDLKTFSKPLAEAQRNQARSQLNDEQKRDLDMLEGDVVRIRQLYSEMQFRGGDPNFMYGAMQEVQGRQQRLGAMAQKYANDQSNMRVIIDPRNGEVYTRLSWQKNEVSPEMAAQGHKGVAYSLTSAPGRNDHELAAVPLGADGKPDGNFMKYRVASDHPQHWQGIAAGVGDAKDYNGYYASAPQPGNPSLHTEAQLDPSRMNKSQSALANQAMADLGLTWPTGQSKFADPNQGPGPQGPQGPQKPPSFWDRMRYAFTGDPSSIGNPQANWNQGWNQNPWNQQYNWNQSPWQQNVPPYPNWQTTMPYPYPNPCGSWGTGWGGQSWGMDPMMKMMMATSVISSIAFPLTMFATMF